MSYTDSTTGKVIDGKAYVLKSTEGEEIVDPARLFAGAEVEDLAARVAALEAALGVAPGELVQDQAPVEGQELVPAEQDPAA